MEDFINHCVINYQIDNKASDALKNIITTRHYKKKDYLLRPGEVCKYLYFINQGLVKVYSFKHDNEFIMRFFAEDIIFSIFDSFITQTPSQYTIQALENTSVTLINYHELIQLSAAHHSIERLLRIIGFQTAARMTIRINEILEENATERYNLFLKENNEMMQRIALGDIAKYLGITQQSLSRIRLKRQISI